MNSRAKGCLMRRQSNKYSSLLFAFFLLISASTFGQYFEIFTGQAIVSNLNSTTSNQSDFNSGWTGGFFVENKIKKKWRVSAGMYFEHYGGRVIDNNFLEYSAFSFRKYNLHLVFIPLHIHQGALEICFGGLDLGYTFHQEFTNFTHPDLNALFGTEYLVGINGSESPKWLFGIYNRFALNFTISEKLSLTPQFNFCINLSDEYKSLPSDKFRNSTFKHYFLVALRWKFRSWG